MPRPIQLDQGGFIVHRLDLPSEPIVGFVYSELNTFGHSVEHWMLVVDPDAGESAWQSPTGPPGAVSVELRKDTSEPPSEAAYLARHAPRVRDEKLAYFKAFGQAMPPDALDS